jgi:hypothetical protein
VIEPSKLRAWLLMLSAGAILMITMGAPNYGVIRIADQHVHRPWHRGN